MRPTPLLFVSLVLGCGGGGGSSDAAPDGGPDAQVLDAVRADAAPPDARAVPVTTTFTVVTVNLRHDVDQWERRFELIADELHRLDPDLVGMQEVEIDVVGQTEALQAELAERYGGTSPYTAYDELKTGLVGAASGEGIGLLSKHPIQAMGFDDLQIGGRLATWARIEIAEGVVVDLYNTHLESGGTAEEFAHQIEKMFEGMDSREAGHALILTGDMNAEADDPPIDAIDERFVDSYLAVHGAKATAQAGNTSSVVLAEGAFEQTPTRRIDYVFGRDPILGELVPTSSEVVFKNHDDAGFYPSDHFGVITTYELTVR